MSLSQFQKNNKFLMIAVDHRGSFAKVVSPQNPAAVSRKEIVEAKTQIIKTLADQASGILVDVKTCLPAYELVEAAGYKPLLLAIEESGYVDRPEGRITKLAYSVSQLKKLGAQAVKILIYFNPFSETSRQQLATARKVLSDCQVHNLPFFLEIVTYHTDQSVEKKTNLVVESVRRFLAESIRPDVFKIEFPGTENDCREVSRMLKNIPWILLTRGGNFYLFKHQLQVAAKNGCQGFLAGRALWQELGEYPAGKRDQFMEEIVKVRFEEITETVLGSKY